MTSKQERFCQEFSKDCNAAAAARRAGYSARSAKQIGAENLTKLDLLREIQENLQRVAERAEVDAVWIRAQLKVNVERAMQANRPLDKDGNPLGDWQYNGAVANKALELLGKDLGMFTHRKENTPERPPVSIIEIHHGLSA